LEDGVRGPLTEIRDWLADLPRRVVVESLVEKENFGAAFMQAMRFAWV
jgi:hypothetical protein